ILSVLKGSPAAQAGLERGDRIRSIDGVTCHDPKLLGRALVLRRPGQSLRLGVADRKEEITVTLGDRGEAERKLLTPGLLGLTCVELDDGLRGWLELDAGVKGVAVREVRAQSPAAKAGLRRGDVIVEASGAPVADLEELDAAVAAAEGEIFVKARRKGEKLPLGYVIRFPSSRIRSKAR
ncbi:MAG: PDZ domain-containing protein, partial [Planctomycetota bacterium]